MTDQLPVFDSYKNDADRDVLATPLGYAATEDEALMLINEIITTAMGDPFEVTAAEINDRFGVTGWFIAAHKEPMSAEQWARLTIT